MGMRRGFTLIELLIVIAIIGILASIIFASLGAAREKAKIAATQAQLQEIMTAELMLRLSTGKSIGGCPIGPFSDLGNQFSLADPEAGLSTRPSFSSSGSGRCSWTAEDAIHWEGPYIQPPLDPWGNLYYYDADYKPRLDCGSPGTPIYAAISSGGPNGVNGAAADQSPYDCDDIYVLLDQ